MTDISTKMADMSTKIVSCSAKLDLTNADLASLRVELKSNAATINTAELDQTIRAQAEIVAAPTARIQLFLDAQRPSSISSIESSLSALTAIQTDQSCPPSPLISTPLFPILPPQLFSSYTTIKPDIPLSISQTCISDKLSIFRLVPYDNHCAQTTIPRPLPWPTFFTSFIEFSLRPLPWPNILISSLELCRLPLKSQFCLLSHASSL